MTRGLRDPRLSQTSVILFQQFCRGLFVSGLESGKDADNSAARVTAVTYRSPSRVNDRQSNGTFGYE